MPYCLIKIIQVVRFAIKVNTDVVIQRASLERWDPINKYTGLTNKKVKTSILKYMDRKVFRKMLALVAVEELGCKW